MITKSKFIDYCQCPKKAWLKEYKKHLATPVTEEKQHVFDTGREVGTLARELFPDGVLIKDPAWEYSQALENTKRTLKNGTNIIFEGAFTFKNLFARIDILEKNEDASWDLIEVKSSTSTKEGNFHVEDLAIQKLILGNAGIKINKSYIKHLNKEYIKRGTLELQKLFARTDLTQEVEATMPKLIEDLNKFVGILKKKEEVEAKIGSHCYTPYECDFKDYCWGEVKTESILNLYYKKGIDKFELFYSGIKTLSDIKDTNNLSETQKLQVKSFVDQEAKISKSELKTLLNTLEYPLYFLDFETCMTGVPMFENIWPYQQVVTQASLHIKENESSELRHLEILSDHSSEPSKEVAKFLCEAIGDKGSVIVWHKTFEKGRLKEMGEMHSEYKEKLDQINSRVWDLKDPFKDAFYIDYRFKGSNSIKDVLPVLVPELSYKELEIQNGGIAIIKYLQMINKETPQNEREQIKENLLKYCELDTLAMVEIFEKLQEVIVEV